jgi:hypothetical protein
MSKGRDAMYLGIDLGWTTGATGVAAADSDGRLIASGRVQTDDEIANWIERHSSNVVVIAVDARWNDVVADDSAAPAEADLAGGQVSHVERTVMSAPVVPAAKRKSVGQVGGSALGPGVTVVDVAPGERPLASFGGAGLVPHGQRPGLTG